jgi:hypothetical protein
MKIKGLKEPKRKLVSVFRIKAGQTFISNGNLYMVGSISDQVRGNIPVVNLDNGSIFGMPADNLVEPKIVAMVVTKRLG